MRGVAHREGGHAYGRPGTRDGAKPGKAAKPGTAAKVAKVADAAPHEAREWSLPDIEARLDEAVDTLKRVPAPGLRRHVTRWPDFVHDSVEAYGYGEIRLTLRPAAPDAIDRLDETLGWLRWLPREAQRILWSRANGFSWRKIAYFVGKAPNTCRTWHLAALHHLAARLNGTAGPIGPMGAVRKKK